MPHTDSKKTLNIVAVRLISAFGGCLKNKPQGRISRNTEWIPLQGRQLFQKCFAPLSIGMHFERKELVPLLQILLRVDQFSYGLGFKESKINSLFGERAEN